MYADAVLVATGMIGRRIEDSNRNPKADGLKSMNKSSTSSPKQGIIYLVGGGPGDPGLITVKGMKCLQQADVVIYDSLVNRSLLRYANSDAELIFVGKRAEQKWMEQEGINELLVNRGLQGKTVVRLKGGDPCLFARGGEEAEAIVAAGIPFEFVPGVSSATAVPAYAGIPVTHRHFTSSLAVVTGHRHPEKPMTAGEWQRIATSAGTMVFVMIARRLNEITSNLMEYGRSPDTPVAIIQWGTLPEQRTVEGTLENIVERFDKAGMGAPAVMIVGDVVTLRSTLKWYEMKPLFGHRIVVTRSQHQASALVDLLEFFGAETLEFPTIQIEPVSDNSPLDEQLLKLNSFDWLIFTSVNAVDAVFDRLNKLGLDARALAGVKLCAIGPATSAALEGCRLNVDMMPPKFKTESIVEELGKLGDLSGKRFLLPRADIAPPTLPAGIMRLGAEAVQVDAYKTTVPSSAPEHVLHQFQNGAVSWVTFTSSSTAENFAELIGENLLSQIRDSVRFAAIGPTTASTMKEKGIPVSVIAAEHTIPGLVDAVLNEVGQR
ncbi:MAG: uroporphyrinogen-III C-methyltransferase [Planctomycetota bacterium]|nr:uroporphyrinogen-III C-methyltransferase [Planctomycetota bacterium]MDA1142245.1 uroporphyrinogen-III C-methyltransferase [Planctomycetota bacterium]